MILHEETLPEIKKRVWEKFKKHHYTPERFRCSAWVFVATEIFDGKEVIVGMSAALPAPRIPNGRCSHKVVVLPPSTLSTVWASSEKVLLPDFDKNQMWRAIADAQAAMFVNAGHPYYCNAGLAPSELVAYRDDPASGWVPTTKNGKPPKDKGHGPRYGNKPRCTNAAGLVVSHRYVGAIAAEERA